MTKKKQSMAFTSKTSSAKHQQSSAQLLSQPLKGTKHKKKRSMKCKHNELDSESNVVAAGSNRNKHRTKKQRSELEEDALQDEDENVVLLMHIDKAMKNWTLSVYDHFHLPPEIKRDAEEDVKYVFTCKRHRSMHTHSCKDNSTSNLKGHAEKCDFQAQQDRSGPWQQKIGEIASKYMGGEFRYLMVEWLMQCHWPNTIIEDVLLQKIFQLLNPVVNIHSDIMAGHNVKEIYEVSKEQLKRMLKAILSQFKAKHQLGCTLITIEQLLQAWLPDYLYSHITSEALLGKGLLSLAVTEHITNADDQAGGEDSDVDEVEDDEDDALDADKTATLEDLCKDLEDEKNCMIDKESDNCPEVINLTVDEVNLGVSALTKNLLQVCLESLCKKQGISVLKMICHIITHWNTTFNVIDRGVALCPALNALCMEHEHEHNKGKPPLKQLKHFLLSDEEWEVLMQLQLILEIFLKATEHISRSAVPLLHEVILTMDSITKKLKKYLKDATLYPAVCADVAHGLAITDKYYSKTDESIM
ncbi:uncharacterized protein EV420DRAFT_1489356 [Desarmillaria tabescens]|uniref:Uncharacterized protein n=1 Tax=Armillaria tabescens TaxID=1929756 RepID=A0AA39MGA1_ARMTA|nr:uncharacterized protein EV420DRAFT_1489356 [Desarmillaria tabescens]KAK0433217.1 hypothetical protein EV420DRAFT_1489356 [Desarmillaria tabescens]